MKKKTILLIVGKSGTGKDTVVDIMQRNHNIHPVVSYTTRKIRDGETNGVEHIFVDKCTYTNDELFAYTVYGKYEYWTLKQDILDMFKKSSIISYIVDEKGVKYLLDIASSDERFGDIEIKTVYLQASEQNRADRDVSKERMARDKNRRPVDLDFIVDNNGTLEELEGLIDILINKIK